MHVVVGDGGPLPPDKRPPFTSRKNRTVLEPTSQRHHTVHRITARGFVSTTGGEGTLTATFAAMGIRRQ